jgi:hypothetical protein
MGFGPGGGGWLRLFQHTTGTTFTSAKGPEHLQGIIEATKAYQRRTRGRAVAADASVRRIT